MDLAKSITASLGERYSDSFMHHTIADAIDDSKREFTDSLHQATMQRMEHPITPQVEILRQIVRESGGPAEFSRKYSKDDADKPIDATYVSQILNGHRPFRDVARKNMATRAGLPDDFFEIKQQVDHKISEPEASFYLPTVINKSKRQTRIESITALLDKTDEEGLAVMLHEAEKIAGQYPLTKQTPASSQ